MANIVKGKVTKNVDVIIQHFVEKNYRAVGQDAGYEVGKQVQRVLAAAAVAECGALMDKGSGKTSAPPSRGEGGSDVPKTRPQQLTRDGQVPAIGKMKDLNTPGNIGDKEFKIADYLPDKGNPKDNWHQNSGILRSVMNEKVPIKDISVFPMENAGFLGAERNLLQSRGWVYLEGYWYPPQ